MLINGFHLITNYMYKEFLLKTVTADIYLFKVNNRKLEQV